MEKKFTFRFDIDSLADMEVGVPKLLNIGKEFEAKFTFFVNMGKSFNWRTILRSKNTVIDEKDKATPGRLYASHMRTIRKMGLFRTARTVILNPDIGAIHKKALFKLLDDGHELGLHGGTDHPVWQWKLNSLSKVEIKGILKPAYDNFTKLFGKPIGFTSPGFKYNEFVLELMDDYDFKYSSDMDGEKPFIPKGYSHLQIPVNTAAPGRMPLIEYLSLSGYGDAELIEKCIAEIAKREIAVIYGHPAYEGRFRALGNLLIRVSEMGYRIVPMGEIAHSYVKSV